MVLLGLCVAACGDLFGPSTSGQLEIGSADITLAVGDTLTVGASVVIGAGDSVRRGPMRWTSSDPSVLSVSADGVIRANSPGRVLLRVRYLSESDTTTVSVRAPTDTAGAQFASISAGEFSTCGLDASGSLACWGDDGRGELARSIRLYTITLSPVLLGNRRFAEVGVGGAHVCALDLDGAVWCWGDGDRGELGTGASGPMTSVSKPERVHSSEQFTTVAVGGMLTCALNSQGQAFCWGYGYAATPEMVGAGLHFDQLSVGGLHACAIDDVGGVYCWGDNSFEQLGTDTIGSSREPVAVGLPAPARSLSAGGGHTCAVLAGGVAYCWGQDWDGNLGDGGDERSSPPVRVALGVPVLQVAAGGRHSCAIAEGGVAYCWGLNDRGQLGMDFPYGVQSGPYMSLVPVAVSTNLKFTSISAGDEHTCALSGTRAYCWGSNLRGQLGIGATHPYPGTEVSVALVPTRVVAPIF